MRNHLINQRSADISTQDIRKVLRDRFNLTFKLINSRASKVNLDRVKAIKLQFSLRFAKLIEDDTLIVNVDEAVISHNTKINYSWVKQGASGEVQNKNISGSISLLMAILNNGSWF